MSTSPKARLFARASQRQLTAWRKLLTKKSRRESAQLLLEGVRLVREAIQSGRRVACVIISDDDHGRSAWKRLDLSSNLKMLTVATIPPREFERLTDTVHAAGIACVIHWEPLPFDPHEAQGLNRVLICDKLSDPGNLGTLIRTAAGLGLDAVVLLAGSVELTNPKTVRSAAGAIFHIPVHEDVKAQTVVSWSRQARIPLFVADAHGGRPIDEDRLPPRWALVIGSETIPLDPIWKESSARRISLPLQHGIESLNSAIAGAIIMDRLCRVAEVQRKSPKRQPS